MVLSQCTPDTRGHSGDWPVHSHGAWTGWVSLRGVRTRYNAPAWPSMMRLVFHDKPVRESVPVRLHCFSDRVIVKAKSPGGYMIKLAYLHKDLINADTMIGVAVYVTCEYEE